MKKFDDYEEIEENMRLYSISEKYYGDVIMENGVLQTDCMGYGYDPISNLDLDDVILCTKPMMI